MIALKDDRMALMYGGQYTEFLRDSLWLYNLNTNLWQNTKIADKGHREEGFFYNCYRCEVCEYCAKETNFNLFRTEGEKIKVPRQRCTSCVDCQTEDKESEDLSLYDSLNKTLTNCTSCSNCIDYDEDKLAKLIEFSGVQEYEKIERFNDC
mmetsp:Transcript_38513/g.58615  ORF Transcript_38513/g.58615 Transcript_38513/m.58615 type:complete len:151 (-) Transcript_38513:1091-1543(-)